MTKRRMQPDNAAVWFHPPLGLVIAILTASLARSFAPLAFFPQPLSSSLGPITVAVSLVFFLWAARTMRSSGASLPPNLPTEVIVSSGPYRLSRNPIYLSMLVLLIGIAIWVDSFWFVLMAGVFAVILFLGVIRPEERYLERTFGEEYVTYRKRVRRWL